MISTFSKAFNNAFKLNLRKTYPLTSSFYQSFSSASPLIYHRLQIQSLSDKWHIDFSYSSGSFSQMDQNKIRPYNYGRVFSIKFVEKSMRFVKGRPQYKVQFLGNEVMKLAYWSPQYGKYQMVRSNQYKQEVFIVQEIIKNERDQFVDKYFGSIEMQNYPVKLYHFNFYNQKVEDEKSKDFYLTPANMRLLQLTLKSSFGGITFNESKQEYEIYNLQRQIVKKQMPIFKEDQKE